MPATTIHAISDDDVVIDNQRNYVIAYSRPGDRPANATAQNGVSWVDWGTQSSHGLLMRWVCISPEWSFPLAPQEQHLDWAHSDWAGSQYDSTLLGVNWRNGFMQCYLPRIHYMTQAEFEALGANLSAEKIPVWVDSTYKTGPSEALLGTMSASSVIDNLPANAVLNANDGDYSTAWSSAFGLQNATITADLGSPKVISAVKLYWDWIFFAKNYTIETSDDNATWVTVATATNENGQIDLYKNWQGVKARYVRLHLTEYNAGWYRLGEFEVYTNDCDCAAPTVSAPEPKTVPLALQIFPNPVGAVLHYKMAGGAAADFEVYDLQGKCLRRSFRQPAEGSLDVGDLPPGAYLLRVSDKKNGTQVKKFVRVGG
jgi:hypothetical protein